MGQWMIIKIMILSERKQTQKIIYVAMLHESIYAKFQKF